MKRTLAAVAVLSLTACGGGAQVTNSLNPDSHSHPAEATAAASASPQAISTADAVATDSVVIKDFLFTPPAIRVKIGTTVTWANQDIEPHTVSVSGPGGFTSSVLKQGDRFTHTFTVAASVPYICSIHPYMKGGVIVTSA